MLSRGPVSVGEWILLEVEIRATPPLPAQGGTGRHTLVLPLSVPVLCPRLLSPRAPQAASLIRSKKEKPPSTILMLSPFPSKFGVRIVYCNFRGASEIQALLCSHFVPSRLQFRCLWNIPVYHLETGFGCPDLLLYPGSLMLANATKPSLMVVSSVL